MYRNHTDYETAARRLLPEGPLGYFAGGSLDESTVAENRAALARIKLRWRALAGITAPDTSVDLLGTRLAYPVIVAPVAFQCMAHPDGETAMARAVAAAGSLMVLSTTSTCPVPDVATASRGAFWFQLYMMKDRGITTELVRRAESAGARAIALTADVPAWGRRERDMRSNFALPAHLVIHSLVIPGREDFYDGRFRSDLAAFIGSRLDFGLTWEDVAWLRSITNLPVVVKGIGHPDDADEAVSSGASAVWVSNHGGRQLDSAAGVADVLPSIAEAVSGRVPIIADGSVCRGTDVVKLLALGATTAAVGRSALWALAAGGEEGATSMLSTLHLEVTNALSLCGCQNIRAVSKSIIFDQPTNR